MNYNIIAYSIYLSISIIVIFKVGKICYVNGDVFITHLIRKEIELTKQINKTLLVGYYLLNIGYTSITLISWEKINSMDKLINSIGNKIGTITIIIAIIHYINILIIKKYINKLT